VKISRRPVADTFDLLGAMLADRCVASERDTKAKDANQLQLLGQKGRRCQLKIAALRNTEI
jgi:hypothetical protein